MFVKVCTFHQLFNIMMARGDGRTEAEAIVEALQEYQDTKHVRFIHISFWQLQKKKQCLYATSCASRWPMPTPTPMVQGLMISLIM
ncbi:hypothetical protein HanRHA438_Chr05g0227391 [Helianthus annuus]|uniref:Uncharacterized protein n=1 Tax=Helianthus annuus TaxID=4232 RepID=A0A9K3NNE8_HELAN|nr:hypothetical protein HanXRQr2_Chr05g0218301 [Helianthus annuus]KAJ0584825.1 hypothetical protein HanHA89_Chr05g0193181 [Helianthus annuus]KAJ0747403.1 hypothetical protein HanOQP8_Chr05g0189021 [Helianthus annuus]KAJ0750488.1 hypothetical protein HanLR1_Chr05g0182521 [Helianthus annuus]KAJ0919245.1 hypothetical protein HanRHA438_Chr05g0227391 [Helianthus annuus]